MGSLTPKQYLALGGRALIEWSLSTLLQAEWIDGVIVVLAPDDARFRDLPVARHPRLHTTTASGERADSVLAGLCRVRSLAAHPQRTVALVHDAARPCLGSDELQRLRDHPAAAEHGALLAVPCVDTLKRATADRASETVDRRQIWRAQTPQLFALLPLLHTLQHGLSAGLTLTDEASAMEHAGYRPLLVPGCESNLKVTYPDDLALAEFWLRRLQRL